MPADLLERLVARDVAVVLVSSAERHEVEYYVDLLDAPGSRLGIDLGRRRFAIQARSGADSDRASAVGM